MLAAFTARGREYMDTFEAITCSAQHKSALERLKTMRRRQRCDERAGHFLADARTNYGRTQWTKGKLRWFQFVDAVSEVSQKLIVQHENKPFYATSRVTTAMYK
jgi:hypothetical protein